MLIKYSLSDKLIVPCNIKNFFAAGENLSLEFDGVDDSLQYIVTCRYFGKDGDIRKEIINGKCTIPRDYLTDGKLLLKCTAFQNGKIAQAWLLDSLAVSTIDNTLNAMILVLPDIESIMLKLSNAESEITELKAINATNELRIKKLEDMLDDPSIV